MVKIRLSYDHEAEAQKVLKVLSPVITDAKIKKSEDGRHKKIYIELRTVQGGTEKF